METKRARIVAGRFSEDGRRYIVYLEYEERPVSQRGGQTIDHQPIPTDAVEVAISGETWRATQDGSRDRRYVDSVSAGQNMDDLRRVKSKRAAELADLWDAHHLNGLTSGCAHQGDEWTCSNDGTRNGWTAVRDRFGPYPYPHRGDACMECDRNRWDEPTDWCLLTDPPYRYGSQWLYRTVPAEALQRLRDLFGITRREAEAVAS